VRPGEPVRPGGPGSVPGSGSDGDLRRRLGLVQVGLGALVADLESVDAVEEELRPLRDLAAELALLARPVAPEGPELERLREQALAVLRAFAAPTGRPGGQGPPPGTGTGRPRRDPGFWKR
jgi:hypothetical protein